MGPRLNIFFDDPKMAWILAIFCMVSGCGQKSPQVRRQPLWLLLRINVIFIVLCKNVSGIGRSESLS